MRDSETINSAISAADTGHLLLSTLHTIGAVNTIDRIVDSFSNNRDQIRMRLATTISAIVSEQLIPTIDGKVIPVFEIMKTNTAIRSQIRENKLHLIENTMISCKNEGMVTMDDSLYDLYSKNIISKETALEYCLHHDALLRRLEK